MSDEGGGGGGLKQQTLPSANLKKWKISSTSLDVDGVEGVLYIVGEEEVTVACC